MIRYYEYLYLAVAICLAIFIAMSIDEMNTTAVIGMVAATAVSAFMYSFRRQQRLLYEAEERERIAELEEQAGEDDD